ncbi:pyridoxamine 5'-phosphate oxidase family protein [Actinoplanes sp. NPDC051851]|uniref:pyridoxamine 5'-phosphate oxidase family protein n=1 Tax=Actinoplanes sp. NPDC051851 TaxID=3154753 RepID=UPI00341E1048
MEEPRSAAQRKADILATLGAPVADVWVATADGDRPFLVPLTMAWIDERIVLATGTDTPVARNLVARRRARVAAGHTRDVVMIDAVLEEVHRADRAERIGAAYVAQNDWDPRASGPGYSFLVLRPERIQAWREVNEHPGRTLMRDGVWLV